MEFVVSPVPKAGPGAPADGRSVPRRRKGGVGTEALLQDRQELLNQSVHNLHKIMERWEHRITPDNLHIDDRFLAGELRLLIHFLPIDSLKVWVTEFI